MTAGLLLFFGFLSALFAAVYIKAHVYRRIKLRIVTNDDILLTIIILLTPVVLFLGGIAAKLVLG